MKKEPTNADIMAELRRQGAKVDRLSAMLEGIASRDSPTEERGLLANVKGLDSKLTPWGDSVS